MPPQSYGWRRLPPPASFAPCFKSMRGGAWRPRWPPFCCAPVPGRCSPRSSRRPRIRSTSRRSIRRRRSIRCPDLGVDWPDMEQGPDDAHRRRARHRHRRRRRRAPLQRPDRGPRRRHRGGAAAAVRPALDARARTARTPPTPPRSTAARARMPICSAELLRARGYYDALVRTRVEAAAAGGEVIGDARGRARARSTASPRCDLPGIDEAGEDAAALREAFGVAANEPVDAAAGDGGRGGAAGRARQARLCLRRGRARWTSRSTMRPAPPTLTLPVNPNGTRQFGRIRGRGPAAVQRQAYPDDRALEARRALSRRPWSRICGGR